MKVPRVNTFSASDRQEIEARLLAGDFKSYRALSAELKARFCFIGKSALQAHRQRLLSQKRRS